VSIEDRTHLFVVSIWWEEREIAGLEPIWRGYIQYERTGKRVYFRDLEDLIGFLHQSAGVPVPSRADWWKCLIAALFRR